MFATAGARSRRTSLRFSSSAAFSIQERSFDCVPRRADTARKEKARDFAQDDGARGCSCSGGFQPAGLTFPLPRRKTPPGWRRYKSCDADGVHVAKHLCWAQHADVPTKKTPGSRPRSTLRPFAGSALKRSNFSARRVPTIGKERSNFLFELFLALLQQDAPRQFLRSASVKFAGRRGRRLRRAIRRSGGGRRVRGSWW